MLKQISSISFPSLTQLSLEGFHIENIEAISWINCKNLKSLFISNNNITNLSPLNKTGFKKLSKL